MLRGLYTLPCLLQTQPVRTTCVPTHVVRSRDVAVVTVVAVVAIWSLTSGCRERARYSDAWQGIVEFDERHLGFEVGGRVREVTVDEGDRVTRDQLLASLDDGLGQMLEQSREHEAAAASAQANLVRAGAREEDIRIAVARLQGAKVREQFLEQNLTRHRRLAGTAAATPQATVDELQSQYLIALAERQALELQLQALRAGARPEEITGADAHAAAAHVAAELEAERVRRCRLLAPDDGVIVEVAMEPGEIAAPGVRVISLADTRHPYADVFVPQGDIGGIHLGAVARIHVDSLQEPLTGRVEYIAARTEFTPRFLFSEQERPNLVVRVRVRIDDPGERLHAGVPAFVYIDKRLEPGIGPPETPR